MKTSENIGQTEQEHPTVTENDVHQMTMSIKRCPKRTATLDIGKHRWTTRRPSSD